MEFFVALLVALLVGCRAAPAPASASAIVLTDDAARTVTLAAPATRVVSLVPSATDAIVALGARAQLVGRTRYDRDPSLAAVTDVGGGLDPNVETVAGLRPDLVVLWAGDRRGDLRERLDALGIPTLALESDDTTDAFRGLALLGRALGRDSAAAALADTVRAQFRAVIESRAGQPRPRAFYVVFNDPPMTASPRTFVGQLLEIAGASNVFADAEQDWPTIAMEELVRRAPDVVVLPTGELGEATLERLRTQPGWRSLAAVQQGRVALVDGDLVNRPGPQMGRAAAALRDAMQQAAP